MLPRFQVKRDGCLGLTRGPGWCRLTGMVPAEAGKHAPLTHRSDSQVRDVFQNNKPRERVRRAGDPDTRLRLGELSAVRQTLCVLEGMWTPPSHPWVRSDTISSTSMTI